MCRFVAYIGAPVFLNEVVCQPAHSLLHQSLQPKPAAGQRTLEALLAEQRRTNRLLQAIVYAGLGFLIGVLVVQWFMHAGYR